MRPELPLRSVAQILAFGVALVLLYWAEVGWVSFFGVVLVGAVFTWVGHRCERDTARWGHRGPTLGIVALGCGLVIAGLVVSKQQRTTLATYLDVYYAVVCWLIGLGIVLTARGAGETSRPNRVFASLWFVLGFVLCLAHSYLKNSVVEFYGSLAGLLGFIGCALVRLRPSKPIAQVLLTVILLGVALPVVDFVLLPRFALSRGTQVRTTPYSFEAAKANPAAFAQWWTYYLRQWAQAEKQISMPDPGRYLPCRLRPGTDAQLIESRIHINSLGFRGKEITREKGDAYRIVVLGESTTFGITLQAEDRPWPELLEELIRQRLPLKRPVEVVNAGVPGYTILDSLHRLPGDILPLKPDLLIAYHGINGFPLLNTAFPRTQGASRVPAYEQRPLRLLANVEYKIKLNAFRRKQTAGLKDRAQVVAVEPLQTPCATAFGQLIEAAATNHIQLALASFSMALDQHSSAKELEFYSVAYPAAQWCIEANRVQTEILKELTERNPRVLFVDTRAGLNGGHQNFLDLVHFSPRGERQMAENVFAALRPLLERAL